MASLLAAGAALAQPSSPPASQPGSGPAQPLPSLPYITIDRAHHWVDIQAKVCVRDAEWLELLMCTPNTHEYESLLVTKAKPSQVQLALLILGLKPGSPMKIQWHGQKSTAIAATGPRVNVSLIYQKNGQTIEVPATTWLRDQKTKKPAAPESWIFAGSLFISPNGQRIFSADSSGALISLVNFGDDVLVLPTDLPNYNGQFPWAPNTPQVPPVGTPVTVRLSPAPAPATQPAPEK